MIGEILVPLKRNDRLEQIIPHLENMVKPGMKVVFLIPYPVEPSLWLKDHWVTTESPREAMLAGKKIMERYSRESQKSLAEQRVFPADEALRRKGAEVAADVYTGSLRKAIRSYMLNGDVQLIMIRARSALRLIKFLGGMMPLFGFLRRPSFSPMLLLHPDKASSS